MKDLGKVYGFRKHLSNPYSVSDTEQSQRWLTSAHEVNFNNTPHEPKSLNSPGLVVLEFELMMSHGG